MTGKLFSSFAMARWNPSSIETYEVFRPIKNMTAQDSSWIVPPRHLDSAASDLARMSLLALKTTVP